MDGLLVVLAIIGWVIAQSKKQKKANGKKNVRTMNGRNAAAFRAERVMQKFAELEKKSIQHDPEPVQRTVGEGESSRLDASNIAAMEPDFRGSLQVESFEGECICDPELEHAREPEISSESVYASEIGGESLVDFSPKGILQGVIMNEILTRPAQRAGRLR